MKNNDAYNELVESWKNFTDENIKPPYEICPPYILKKDEEIIKNNNMKDIIVRVPPNKSKFYNNFYKDQNFESANKLQLYLIPVPYVGDIKKAKIFILTLNPSLGPMDYYAEVENRDTDYIKALRKNLRQEKLDKEKYPFMFLNPEFSWSGGFDYWHERFHRIGIIEKIMEEEGISEYTKALSCLSKKVAVLQLVPYH